MELPRDQKGIVTGKRLLGVNNSCEKTGLSAHATYVHT